MAKTLLLILGWISLGVGFIGIFLPLLPTTPFVLLAAFLFSRSSETLHRWLHSSRIFGKIIRNWEEKGAISLQSKTLASVLMLLALCYPILFLQLHPLLIATALTTCAGVLAFMWTRPTA